MNILKSVFGYVLLVGVCVTSIANAEITSTPIQLTEGSMECYFDIASTKRPSKYEVVKLSQFSVMKEFEYAVETPLLENRILFRYNPGWATSKSISHMVISMSYNSANSGIEMPLIVGQKFVTIIGRQGSDLIGAFLNCTIHSN